MKNAIFGSTFLDKTKTFKQICWHFEKASSI